MTSTGVQVGLSPASYSVLEGNQVSLTIMKIGAADIPVTVILSNAGKTATGIVTQFIHDFMTQTPVYILYSTFLFLHLLSS